jgi:peptidoglycan/xylan/chitin deacetylase (PgdA/CDA1 family)
MYAARTPYFVQTVFKQLVWNIPTNQKILYLTFDDGPTPIVTPWVLKTLDEFSAKATFFCVGKNTEEHSEIYQNILRQGHAVGNHTYHHLNGWKTNKRRYLLDIQKCAKRVDSQLFRPPYGRLRKVHYKEIKDKFSVVMWDVLSGDFDNRISNEKCLRNVVDKVKRGSVVVFHDSLKAESKIRYVLPKVLETLTGKGYQFKAITSDLI